MAGLRACRTGVLWILLSYCRVGIVTHNLLTVWLSGSGQRYIIDFRERLWPCLSPLFSPFTSSAFTSGSSSFPLWNYKWKGMGRLLQAGTWLHALSPTRGSHINHQSLSSSSGEDSVQLRVSADWLRNHKKEPQKCLFLSFLFSPAAPFFLLLPCN